MPPPGLHKPWITAALKATLQPVIILHNPHLALMQLQEIQTMSDNPMIHVIIPGAHRQRPKADGPGIHTRCAAALWQVV